ncbi:MAG TPA: amidohydrolase family protein [Vicinamibacterales bacterium]|nr:amidohydrolase family protein [Vicinamibacterales bacterium]
MIVNDVHCHFFSANFLRTIGRDLETGGVDAATALPAALGWEPPGEPEALADRWIAELDRQKVSRAMLIASVPGDEGSVSAAVRRHPSRFVGAFMFNPAPPEFEARLEKAMADEALGTICLFPAMHHVPLDSPSIAAVFARADRARRAVFVHCGVLSVGVRQKLGLASAFDLRLGDPLAVALLAMKHPGVPVIIPHFGAGRFTEALMAAGAAPNILLDTSSSNAWVRLHPNLTLKEAFARALDVLGPNRLLFGTDSSFFPRGWQRPVYEAQLAVLESLGVDEAARDAVFGGNFNRIFRNTP